MNFKNYHHQASPMLLCNVWDVTSARSAAKLGFQAIGTSSGAMAAMLGYEDGEQMSFLELEYIVKRIRASVEVPLSVDLEAGYSRKPEKIVEHIERLVDLGVIGINLEDSLVTDHRRIVDATEFAETLGKIVDRLATKNIDVFLNVRTDTFLLNQDQPVEETIKRAALYKDVGANGIFVPCIVKEKDIKLVVNQIDLPLNVMCMPDLPDFETLNTLGVKRISMGNFFHAKMTADLEETLNLCKTANSFNSVFTS